MEAIVAIIWVVTTRTLRAIDHLLFRRRPDETSPPLSRLLNAPADFLADDVYTIGPFRRPVTCLVLGLIFAIGGMLLSGVLLFVVVAGIYAILTGGTIWDDGDGMALKIIAITNAVLSLSCIPLGIRLASRVLQGGQIVIRRDGVQLEWKSETVFCPWPVWLSESICPTTCETSGERVCFWIPPEAIALIQQESTSTLDGILIVSEQHLASLADVFCFPGQDVIRLIRNVAFRLKSDGDL